MCSFSSLDPTRPHFISDDPSSVKSFLLVLSVYFSYIAIYCLYTLFLSLLDCKHLEDRRLKYFGISRMSSTGSTEHAWFIDQVSQNWLNLRLKMPIPEFHRRLTESEFLVEPRNLHFHKLLGWFFCTVKVKNYSK